MAVSKVIVSAEEVSQIRVEVDAPSGLFEEMPSPVPWWAKIGLMVLVVVLPVLCLLTIVLRIAFRSQPARVRYAWLSFLSTLLIVSGLITVTAGVLLISLAPIPAIVNTGLPELDERTQFPILPSQTDLSSSDISAKFKPLVIVVSPAARLWTHQEVASAVFGAGVLLLADKDGYLFATANHVANYAGLGSAAKPAHALVATSSGVWATADVVAQAPQFDLALLWVARHAAGGDFVQPSVSARDGEGIFVIGHPEGLKYTLSTGIVSGLREETLQISAPVSPGNSGGPVYDNRGNLIGIVSSKFDHNRDANAENLSFAASTDFLLQPSIWSFSKNGAQELERYIQANRKTKENKPQGEK